MVPTLLKDILPRLFGSRQDAPFNSLPVVRPPASLAVIGLIFALGSAVTLVLYQHFANLDQERVQERVLRGAQILAASSAAAPVTPILLDAIDVLTRVQQAVMQDPHLSKERLLEYQWTPAPPLKETIVLRYMPKVVYNKTASRFEMRNLSGDIEPFTLPITDSAPAGTLPATIRDGDYFPVAIETSGTPLVTTATGLNHYFDWPLRIAMDQARDSGFVTSHTSFPLANAQEIFIVTRYYIPLFTPGALPTTVAERRARLTGFASVVALGPAAEYIDFLPESYLGLDTAFFREYDTLADNALDEQLTQEVGAREFAHETFEVAGGKTHIYARASWTLQKSMQTPDRWWALSIGMLLTTWICSFLLLLRRNASAMNELVSQRTQTLAERTRKLSEVNAALRYSEARYRMLADNVLDIIFSNDVDGICTYISPSITAHTGFSVEDYVGQPFHIHTAPASAEAIKHAQQLARDNPKAFNFNEHFEIETVCKDGTIKNLECALSMLADINGDYAGVLGVARDVTDRKQAEQQRLVLEDAYRQSQKMEAIGTLAGGVAHDFNNLLTGILGHAELMRTNFTLDPRVQDSLGVIETAALRAKELTSQLLGFARKGRLQTTDVHINKLVQETIALLDRTIDKRISIESSLDPRPLTINADPSQISQILLNLAVNARDAMPDGGRLLFETQSFVIDEYFSYSHFEALKPGIYCVISVTDTGVGIARDKLSRIFEPFFTDKPDGKGTGLGLAMVYGVATSHGGTVTVYSEVGIGTVFKVYLPLSPAIAFDMAAPMAQRPISGKGTVLVVDDEAIVRNLAKAMLEQLGYSVLVAEDGVAAVDAYRERGDTIDLVILDMIMPNMGGRECLEHLQQLNPGVKVIISTGYSHDTIANRMSGQQSYGFLQKPYRLQELSEIVATTLAV